MSLKSWIKKRLDIPETKSTSYSGQSFGEILGYGFSTCNKFQWLKDATAFNYYKNVSPVNHAVDLRSDKFSFLFPEIFDNKENRFLNQKEAERIPASKMLKLLQQPSDDETAVSFLKPCAVSYPVTGDIFMLLKAMNQNSDPMTIEYVNPCSIEAFADNNSRNIGKFQMQHGNSFIFFFPEETKTGTRFYTKDGRWELYHIRTFNPNRGGANTGQDLRGMSLLNAIYIEIEQHIEGNFANKSTLENGMRPSGMLELAERIADPTIRDHIKQQIKDFYSGSKNNGNIMLMDGVNPDGDGVKSKFTQMSLSNKDMDFANLLKMDKRQIYNKLGTPLPLVEGESQTFSNYQHADAILYTGEIIPFSGVFYPELTRLLMARYDEKNINRYVLKINKDKIPALDTINTEVETKKINTGVLTFDESRQLLGFGKLKSGGDQIYQPAQLISIGEVENQKQVSKERLSELMKLKGYSQAEIEQKQKEIDVNN